VRASYGATGNNRVSDFAYLSVLRQNVAFNSGNTGSGYYFNNVYIPGSVPTEVGNENLKWETTVQSNVGINLSFLKNRIEFIADVYNKRTKDLLLNASLASSTGYLNGFKNIGTIENRGLELSLNTVNVQTSKFTWSSSFNISFNKNKIIELNDNQPSLTTRVFWNDNFNNSLPYLAKPGQPVALFYGFLFDGIYQYSDFNLLPNGSYSLKDDIVNNGLDRSLIQPGFIKYKDVNGDGVVNANDQTVIGNPQPIHTGGFSNNFRYENFDLNVFFQWSYGNDILNGNRIIFEGSEGRVFLNMFKSMEERWSPDNPSNLLPKAGGYGPNVYSSRTVEDGSFLRLKTVALGYTLPESILKKIKIKSIRVFGSAQNLITWTNYSGVDPEVSVRNSALTPGFDFSSYPKARTITFGLDVTF
jgi:TonB-linked SusC/RagA family outer membrane protein